VERLPLVDVFQADHRIRILRRRQEPPPGLDAVFQPLLFRRHVIAIVEGGMTDDRTGPEVPSQGQGARDAVRTFPADPGVERSRPQVHEGRVHGHPQILAPQDIRDAQELLPRDLIEGDMADSDFGLDPLAQHQRQDFAGQKADRNVGMDFLQDFSHLRHIGSGGDDGISVSQRPRPPQPAI